MEVSYRRQISIATGFPAALLAALWCVWSLQGCDRNNQRNKSRRELTINQCEQLRSAEESAGYSEGEDRDYVAKILNPSTEHALNLLRAATDDRKFDTPVLLRAWIIQRNPEGSVYTLSLEWLENGWNTTGFYVGDNNGDITTYNGPDWGMTRIAPAENLMRFVLVKLYTTKDHKLADSTLKNDIEAPSIDIPSDFLERKLHLGLITKGGTRTAPLPKLREWTFKGTDGQAWRHIDFMVDHDQ